MVFPAAHATQQLQTLAQSRVRLLYTNDLHEHWENAPALVSATDAMRALGQASGADVLTLNAGDTNTSSEPQEWTLGVRVLNRLGVLATTIGNHELDLSIPAYLQGLQQGAAQFKTLISNLRLPFVNPLTDKNISAPVTARPQIINGQNGAYGLIGITRPAEISKIDTALTAQGVAPMDFATTRKLVQAQVDALEQQGIHRIVLLSHMGTEYDQKLAQQVSGVDVIVSGDTHDIYPGVQAGENLFTSPRGEPVLLLQAGCNGEWLGVADVFFNDQGHVIPERNQLVDSRKFPADDQTEALISQAIGPNTPVAELAAPYDNARVAKDWDPVAQMTAYAMRQATGADVALVRSREVRENLPAGPVGAWQLKTLMPYADPVVVVRVSGADLQASLARVADGLANPWKRISPLLHASGLRYTVTPKAGQVQSATIYDQDTQQWQSIDPQRTYTVAVSRYTVDNPIEFPELSHPEAVVLNTQRPLRSFFEGYLSQLPQPVVLPKRL